MTLLKSTTSHVEFCCEFMYHNVAHSLLYVSLSACSARYWTSGSKCYIDIDIEGSPFNGNLLDSQLEQFTKKICCKRYENSKAYERKRTSLTLYTLRKFYSTASTFFVAIYKQRTNVAKLYTRKSHILFRLEFNHSV